MKHWAICGFIGTYLTALAGGLACQTLETGLSAHPAMYYFVWDMYCGWSLHENRFHILAEGVSGEYYELAPSPWATFEPFGDLARHHYDVNTYAFGRIAKNVLDNTEHEPIARVLVVEEYWPKKYNLPDHLWARRFEEPKEQESYFWTRSTYSPDGEMLAQARPWLEHMKEMTVSNNPRLQEDARRGRPFFALTPEFREKAPTAYNTAAVPNYQ